MVDKQTRTEFDSMGAVEVPADSLWGAQTQRSKENFQIGQEKMPAEIIRAFAFIKKAAAVTNAELGVLDAEKAAYIAEAAEAIIDGQIGREHFPLSVWQTGSGTQSNMNVNEVIAHYANEKYGDQTLHPNDHVNRSQSSNDTFPTAMSVAGYLAIQDKLLPELDYWIELLEAKENQFQDLIKIGRTHLQDAVPLTVGQEISAWKQAIIDNKKRIQQASQELTQLALGGTAVGTGLNAPENFAGKVAERLAELLGQPFQTAPNKFTSLSMKGEFAYVHGALAALAGDLMKVANDIRLLASGPRAGIGEYSIPSNEPGSSIMPGKVNPTQAEALTMVVAQVLGNDTTIKFSSSQGAFQLNVYLPVIAHNFLQSVNLLTDGMKSFRKNCLAGLDVDRDQLQFNLDQSLMLVTALAPKIGYDKAAEIAYKAHQEKTTLKEATLALGYLNEEEFKTLIDPTKLV